jgi:hypothetical protein
MKQQAHQPKIIVVGIHDRDLKDRQHGCIKRFAGLEIIYHKLDMVDKPAAM